MDATAWQALSLFALVLRLVDFSGLRPVLAARRSATSTRGRVPFDPVSLFLLFGWQLLPPEAGRTEALRHLAAPRYADYAQAFGFRPGVYPTESGLRHFLTTLGRHNLTALLVQSMLLVRDAGLLPPAVQPALGRPRPSVSTAGSTMPPPASVAVPSRRVALPRRRPTSRGPARPRPRASAAAPARPEPVPPQAGQHATPRDPDARFVWYTGSNGTGHPNPP